jgi:hypothetical protein
MVYETDPYSNNWGPPSKFTGPYSKRKSCEATALRSWLTLQSALPSSANQQYFE